MRGGQIVIESTPWLESGLLYELDRDNFGNPTSAMVARCPTAMMRDDPRVHAMIASERARDPDNAAQEYDARFISGGASTFFDPTSLARAIDHSRPLVLRAPHGAIVRAGGDLGLVADSSTLVVGAHLGPRLALLESLELRPTPGAPQRLSFVVKEFAAMCRRHEIPGFTADGHVA